jgi:transcriptional regulator with GAF, ATPase, and Fis domain
MAQLIVSRDKSPEQRFILQKKITTVGTEPNHDLAVCADTKGLLFTLHQQGEHFEIIPAMSKIRVNGLTIGLRTTLVRSCDRIDWNGGRAVFLNSLIPMQERGPEQDLAARSLIFLQNLASTLQAESSLQAGLHQTLDALVEMSGAEAGHLFSEIREGSGWELMASHQEPGASSELNRKQLFSNTILQEALSKRGPVYAENIIGHPWSEAASVIEARIFSAACFPLCVAERVFGAVFLFTRSPGRVIKQQALPELSLLATQAALLLGMEAKLLSTQKEVSHLKALIPSWPGSLVFESQTMHDVAKRIEKLAPTSLNVLIVGETGTGKERVAEELHQRSAQRKGPLVAVNCAAIPASLLESILFGHVKGAFTGAVRDQPGKFMQAKGGTLFLDEIGDIPLELQSKLLRAIQEKRVEPLGSSQSIPIDVRILAATHQDLEAGISKGRFRQDLYFRLNGATLKLPPLRDRRGDIAVLAKHFLQRAKPQCRLSAEALESMERYPWPGNVRELEQVMTRAAFLTDSDEIRTPDLELDFQKELPEGTSFGGFSSLQEAQAAFTREYALKALQQNRGSKSDAAKSLGISERTLYRILTPSGNESSGALSDMAGKL